MSNELVESIKLDAIVAGRNAAIQKWMETYDTFHVLTNEAAMLSIGGMVSLPVSSYDHAPCQ